MPIQFTSADEGKQVVTPGGAVVGRVDHIQDGTVYVTPRSGVLDGFGPRIGPGPLEREAFPLDTGHVDALTDVAVVLTEETQAEHPRGSRPPQRHSGSE